MDTFLWYVQFFAIKWTYFISELKMAIAHYQFEAINPFTDSNGRTGRILNQLYLIHEKLLTHPVLYLSKYIIENKDDYYHLLGGVTLRQAWKPWIMYVLMLWIKRPYRPIKKLMTSYFKWMQPINRDCSEIQTTLVAPELNEKSKSILFRCKLFCKILE